MRDDDLLIGRLGKVSVPIPAHGPGEVLLDLRGGREAYAAWAEGPIPKHRAVVVVELRGPRSVVVAAVPEADALLNQEC